MVLKVLSVFLATTIKIYDLIMVDLITYKPNNTQTVIVVWSRSRYQLYGRTGFGSGQFAEHHVTAMQSDAREQTAVTRVSKRGKCRTVEL